MATRTRRPAPDHYQGCELLGRTEKGYRVWIAGAREQGEYLLVEDAPGPCYACRLYKLSGDEYHPAQRGSYAVEALPEEGQAACNCWGFLRHRKCKHARSVLDLLAAGKVGRPPEPKGPAQVETWEEWSEIFV